MVLRAKIVLLAAAGTLNKDIAAELNTGMKTICLWRNRFAKSGLAGIEKDAPRGGRCWIGASHRKIARQRPNSPWERVDRSSTYPLV